MPSNSLLNLVIPYQVFIEFCSVNDRHLYSSDNHNKHFHYSTCGWMNEWVTGLVKLAKCLQLLCLVFSPKL